MSDVLERNKELVRELTDEMWLKADPVAVPRYFAADYRHTDPLAPQVRTRDDLVALVTALPTMISDMTITVHDLVAEGDKVVKRYTLAATHTGEMNGIPATGRRYEIAGSEMFTIRDGMVVETVNLYDGLGMLMQLGIIPAPEPATAS